MEQEQRTNAGYVITDSIQIGSAEFVIGEKETRFGTMYVTWQCKNGNNYFGGHYLNDRGAAEKDLLERADRELEYRTERKDNVEKPPQRVGKERGR